MLYKTLPATVEMIINKIQKPLQLPVFVWHFKNNPFSCYLNEKNNNIFVVEEVWNWIGTLKKHKTFFYENQYLVMM